MEEINPKEIQAHMVMKGVTNADIAKELGLTRGAITHVFKQGKNTGYMTLNNIIRAIKKLSK